MDDTIESNWGLQWLVGKVVSNFVRRKEDSSGGQDYHREKIKRSLGAKDYFSAIRKSIGSTT